MIGGEARATPGAAVSGRISSNHGVVDVTAPDLERFPELRNLDLAWNSVLFFEDIHVCFLVFFSVFYGVLVTFSEFNGVLIRARAMPPSLVWSWAAKKPRAPINGAATLRAQEALPRIAVLVM